MLFDPDRAARIAQHAARIQNRLRRKKRKPKPTSLARDIYEPGPRKRLKRQRLPDVSAERIVRVFFEGE